MEERKVSYEQIKKANEEIETIKLGNKGYAQVNERIKAFRKVYPDGEITTHIVEIREDYVRTQTYVRDSEGRTIATGSASETNNGNNKVNQTSMIENCETSSVGRALGFAGFGVDTSVASAEDISRNKNKIKEYEIFTNMFIKDEEAKYIVKVCIADLMRKFGVRKVELESVVRNNLWTELEDLTTHQLLRLETKLKTINMPSNDWNELYNKNERIKEVVPEGQEVSYESSAYKFGKMALEMAGTDELLRNEIIEDYLNAGINLI